MAYTPINWQTGDTITAAKLNKMDNGWSVESGQLFSETVTTVMDETEAFGRLEFVASSFPMPQTLVIRFDGTDYVCNSQGVGGYGSTTEDFSDGIPFFLVFGVSRTVLYTPTAGTFNVSASFSDAQVSDNFKAAVFSIAPQPMLCVLGRTTYDEMKAAADAGRLLYFWEEGACRFITNFLNEESATAVTTVPAANPNAETFGFKDLDGTLVFQNFFA